MALQYPTIMEIMVFSLLPHSENTLLPWIKASTLVESELIIRMEWQNETFKQWYIMPIR